MQSMFFVYFRSQTIISCHYWQLTWFTKPHLSRTVGVIHTGCVHVQIQMERNRMELNGVSRCAELFLTSHSVWKMWHSWCEMWCNTARCTATPRCRWDTKMHPVWRPPTGYLWQIDKLQNQLLWSVDLRIKCN